MFGDHELSRRFFGLQQVSAGFCTVRQTVMAEHGRIQNDEIKKKIVLLDPCTHWPTSSGWMREEWRRWWDTTEQKGHEYFGQFRVKPDKIFEMDNRSLISTANRPRLLQQLPAENTHQIEDAAAAAHHIRPQRRCPRYTAARALMR